MSTILSFEDLENLQFGDVVYTAHDEDESFVDADNKSAQISFYLKWLVLCFHYDLYCSLFTGEAEKISSIGLFSLQEIMEVSLKFKDGNPFEKYKIFEKIDKLDTNNKSNVAFNKSRVLSGKWIHKFEKSPDLHSGMNCCECNEYYRYAVPNLTNNKMACWNCRDSYSWKYSSLFVGN